MNTFYALATKNFITKILVTILSVLFYSETGLVISRAVRFHGIIVIPRYRDEAI